MAIVLSVMQRRRRLDAAAAVAALYVVVALATAPTAVDAAVGDDKLVAALLDPGHARNNATDRRNVKCDLSLKYACTVLGAVVNKWYNGTDMLSRLLAAKGRPEAGSALQFEEPLGKQRERPC
jgi:hypothetical protein